MRTSFWGPSNSQEKPRFTRYNLTSLETSIASYKANDSFNTQGSKVPLFAYRGVEPLLPQFVDCCADKKNSTPVCYGLFNGTYNSLQCSTSWVQNIKKNLFFEISSSLSYDTLDNIVVTPTNKQGCALSSQDLINHPEIPSYLKILQTKFFESPDQNNQKINYIGPTFFLFGYTTTLNDIGQLDFLDLSFQTGCIVPIILLEHSAATISLFPKGYIVNLGIPFQLTCSLGLYDWLNVGFAGSVTTYIKNDRIIHLNSAQAPNKFIMPQEEMCSIYHKPNIALSAYIEGEYFLPNWTWYVGIAYSKQYETQLEAQDKVTFPTQLINKYSAYYPWEMAYITLSSEFDLSKNNTQALPRCKFMYVRPFYGSACFNSRILSGHVGLEIIYDF